MLLAMVAARSAVDVVAGWIVHAGELSAAVAALLALGAVLWRMLRHLVRIQNALATVERRSAELETNGGGSLKDAANATCERLTELEKAVAGVHDDVVAVAERLNRHLIGGGW